MVYMKRLRLNRGLKMKDLGFCSLAVFVGLSPAETMQLGGWSDVGTMTRIYTHISEANRLKAQNKISKFFENAK